ncbi:STAS domain-containing protein [Ideonella sp. 4Y11]|uniref:STAS domain-containing protein n=1 Tax=Ideonella aquatica TaxID=2824119 RepID=A0A940YJA2_9BURK|nr:STAS domain-containing protein [Ideonella aquatica]MBQ0958102.1 STAS domain-containing protein [Ideonella aquatica]
MLALPAQLTLREARQTLATLSGELASAQGEAVVDASPLTQIDSSALAVLLELKRQAASRGLRFEVRGAPARLQDLARLYGVQALLALS